MAADIRGVSYLEPNREEEEEEYIELYWCCHSVRTLAGLLFACCSLLPVPNFPNTINPTGIARPSQRVAYSIPSYVCDYLTLGGI
jgi:hypothetical protein